MTISVGELLRKAMIRAGVLEAGEPIPPSDGGDLLKTFEQMVDDWSNEQALIPVVTTIKTVLSSGQAEYTIGKYPEPLPDPLPDNHIETSRPVEIMTAFIRDNQGSDYYLKTMDSSAYARINRKQNKSRPGKYYLRKGWPLNTILLSTAPYQDEELHLEMMQPLSEFLSTACLTDVVNLPPGYEKALINNMVLEIAPEYGMEPNRMVVAQAIAGLKKIKRANKKEMLLTVDRALLRRNREIGTYIVENGPY